MTQARISKRLLYILVAICLIGSTFLVVSWVTAEERAVPVAEAGSFDCAIAIITTGAGIITSAATLPTLGVINIIGYGSSILGFFGLKACATNFSLVTWLKSWMAAHMGCIASFGGYIWRNGVPVAVKYTGTPVSCGGGGGGSGNW